MNLRISRAEQHRLHLCLELASSYKERKWKKAMELGEEIPCAMRRQVLGQLVHLGIVEARAGRSGGYRLTRQPSAISVWEIVAPDRKTTVRTDAASKAIERAVDRLRSSLGGVSLGALIRETDVDGRS
jgi:DNA-binding IscR family transcriptional regulator